jgi:hypothetical protein
MIIYTKYRIKEPEKGLFVLEGLIQTANTGRWEFILPSNSKDVLVKTAKYLTEPKDSEVIWESGKTS